MHVDASKYYGSVLATLRKNTLDIIDFEYDLDEEPDTTMERHAYKDYTAMSDVFVDFLFDPIALDKINSKHESLRTSKDKKKLDSLTFSRTQVSPYVNIEVPDGSGGTKTTAQQVNLDFDLLEGVLSSTFGELTTTDDFRNALELFEDVEGVGLTIDGSMVGLDGDVVLRMEGITRLKSLKWLLRESKKIIKKNAAKSLSTPYLEDKYQDIHDTFETFEGLIESNAIDGLKELVEFYIPDYLL